MIYGKRENIKPLPLVSLAWLSMIRSTMIRRKSLAIKMRYTLLTTKVLLMFP